MYVLLRRERTFARELIVTGDFIRLMRFYREARRRPGSKIREGDVEGEKSLEALTSIT